MFVDRKTGRTFARIYIENVLLICHGLPYEPGSVVEKGYSNLANFFASRNIPSLIFDFSGTGLSEGVFSLKAWVEDIINIAKHFDRVSILGYSMGGAVAVRAALELKNLEKLVIAASPCCADTFGENILRMIYENARIKNLLRGIGGFEEFRNSFLNEFMEIEPVKWIEKVEAPKLIIHGREDDIVPFENAIRLYELAKKPKTFIELKKGDHFLRQNLMVSKIIADWLSGKIKDERLVI